MVFIWETLGILALVEAAILTKKRLPARAVFWFSAITVFLTSLGLSINLYLTWMNNGFTRYFLPPYNPLSYFLLYSGFKFFFPHILSLSIALLFVFWMTRANRKHEEKFFENGEPYLAGLAIFLSGHPGWLIYLPVLVLSYLAVHFWERIRGRKNERIPLYHLWIPAGLFVILINAFWLSHCSWWLKLRI